jgi:hypothetical protein
MHVATNDFFWGIATVPVALAGVLPASLTINPTSPISEEAGAGKVFGETPKTAVETTALPRKVAQNSAVASAAPRLPQGPRRPRG